MDVFGQAILDHFHGNRSDSLYQRDGATKYQHRIEEYYFREFHTQPGADWIAAYLDGPLLDIGAGAGRDTLHFQDKFETTALEISSPLVQLLNDRNVNNICHGDMFSLHDLFPPNKFRSLLINGTHVGLVKSHSGFREFLEHLDQITLSKATVVFDCYDPTIEGAERMLGYRTDPTPGLGFRVYHYEYDGNVGKTLLFRLFSLDQVRSILTDSIWALNDYNRPHDTYHMQIALSKTP